MTDEEINKAIAEVCGWHTIAFNRGWVEAGDGEIQATIPDYCNDLNETHRVWESLTLAQKKQFEIELYRVVISDGDYNRNDDAMKITNASAKERAMALLATLTSQKQ